MKKLDVKELLLNPMDKIAHEWMLITAGTLESGYNTMTASWGHLGSIWGHGGGLPTSVIFVRPQRYTKEFIDREDYYTLSFFPAEYKKALGYLGSHSGRDEDKVAAVNFHPISVQNGVTFEEASLTLVCRKLYRAPIAEENFIDKSVVEDCYPKRDFHDMYIGEIVEVYTKDA
ncbi:MAG: flavin reductase [Clostridia bacterium]|nr:flavin reductase [Clostridia bacterium]